MKQNVVMKQRAIKRVLAMVVAMLFAIGGASAQLHSLGLSAAEAAGAALGLRTEWGVGLKGVYTSVALSVWYSLSISKTVNHVLAQCVNYVTTLYTIAAPTRKLFLYQTRTVAFGRVRIPG